MLKILIDSSEFNNYLKGKRFIEFPNAHFDRMKQAEWFEKDIVKQIIKDIDKAHVELGYSIVNNVTGLGYSVDDLSGGSKFLILVYNMRDRIFLATMGDNCTDLLEQIALVYEKEGKDLIIVSNYLHQFNFKYIKEIEYINWNIRCNSWEEVCREVYPKFLNHFEKKRGTMGE